MLQSAAAAHSELVAQTARVLIVDDEPRQRSSLAELMALRGYRVDTACNGSDAWQQLQESAMDVVLLDIRMSGMDGHEVLRRIRDAGLDVAVIVVSGDPTTEDASRAFKAGADDYLRKPYAPEQIYAAVDNSLGKRALAAQNVKMRRRLEQSERLHRLVVNQSPDLMLILDVNRCIRFVNQAADFVLGYRPEYLHGRPIEILLDAADHPRIRELLALDPDRPQLRTAEVRLLPRRAATTARVFELLATPLAFQTMTGAPGTVQEPRSGGAYIVARDISDRLRNEALVRENEQRFRDFSEIAADCLWETDAQGRLRLLSQSFDRCFAMPAGGLEGRSLVAALGELVGDDPALLRIAAAMTDQMPFEVEVDGLEPRHPACAVIISGQPFFDRDGTLAGYRGIGRDVSDLRHKDRELRLNRERLEALVRQRTHDLEIAQRELESFSASVSHDLRTPLRAITGFSSLLLEEHSQALDPMGRGYLQRIMRATAKISALIDELLGLSRVTRQGLIRQPCDLAAIAIQVDASLRKQAPERRVVFECTGPLPVEADPRLLQLAVYHLLDNAWKFTRPRDNATVSLTQSMVDGRRVFSVSDNGVGFDAHHAGKLFRPFERLHTEERFEGNGIGLATVARIVHRHGGRIWADAAVDAGARFHFTLPDRDEAMALAGREPTRPVRASPANAPDAEPGP